MYVRQSFGQQAGCRLVSHSRRDTSTRHDVLDVRARHEAAAARRRPRTHSCCHRRRPRTHSCCRRPRPRFRCRRRGHVLYPADSGRRNVWRAHLLAIQEDAPPVPRVSTVVRGQCRSLLGQRAAAAKDQPLKNDLDLVARPAPRSQAYSWAIGRAISSRAPRCETPPLLALQREERRRRSPPGHEHQCSRLYIKQKNAGWRDPVLADTRARQGQAPRKASGKVISSKRSVETHARAPPRS